MAAEKQFEKQVEKFLIQHGVYRAGTPEHEITGSVNGWFTKIWGGGFQKEGIPDILMCVNGVFVSVELKAKNGKPSEMQVKNTNLIRRSGGIGLILYPDGFQNFKELVLEVIECNCPTVGLKLLKSVHGNFNSDTYPV